MLIFRYFMFVGGALLALLLVTNAYLPKLPVEQSANADLPVIRIHSDRKWPEAVVFDTSHPVIIPAHEVASIPATPRVAAVSARARIRGAFAQMQPAGQKQAEPVESKPEKKPPPNRRVAKRHAAPPVMLVAQQPQFGLFGNNTW